MCKNYKSLKEALSGSGLYLRLQKSKQLTAFADDADLIGRGTLAVKESFVEMQTTAKDVALLVNEEKAKYLTLDKGQELVKTMLYTTLVKTLQ